MEQQIISSFDAKTHLSQLLAQVATGKEFLITKRGKPVARLTSCGESVDHTMTVDKAIAKMREFRASRKPLFDAGWTYEDARSEGRK